MPDYKELKELMWQHFLDKEYDKAARTSADVLEGAFALDAIHVAGLALVGMDRMDEGFEWTVASLALSRDRPDWFANAAIAFMDKKDYPKAMLFLTNGVEKHPQDTRLSYMRGLTMCYAQEWERSIEFLDQTLALDPTFYHARMSKGFSLHMLGFYDEAIEQYKLIDNAEPADREEVINNWSCVLMEQGKQKEALDLLMREYGESERPGTLYNRAFLSLGNGEWPLGWDLYRNRQTVQIKGDQGVPVVDQPSASCLEDIVDKHLFMFHEQGLGDSLQFLRYAKILSPLVSHLTIGVPKTLHRLVETMDIGDDFTVISDGVADAPVFQKCDIAIPMMDAPILLKTTIDTIHQIGPYFHVPQKVLDKHQLPDSANPFVGLVWAGSSRPDNIRAYSIDKRRSIPYEVLEPILSLSDRFTFVSLQQPDHVVDDRRLLQPIRQDFDVLDTAAIVKQLDLVITIDSAMCHLAGALDIPVWMMSRYDCCWRWFWVDETSPYYERTPWYRSLKLYRQKAHGTWPEVVGRVANDLRDWSLLKEIRDRTY